MDARETSYRLLLDEKRNGPFIHHFATQPNAQKWLKDFATLFPTFPQDHKHVLDAFLRNFTALVATATLPVEMALATVQNQRYSQILAAERILRLSPEYENFSKDENEAHALRTADQKFEQETKSEEGGFALAYHLLCYLENLLRRKETALAADELLRQSTTLVWGALEVLANDLFISLLNEKPILTELLLNDERTKKRFQLREPMTVLAAHGYDLKGNMGEVLNESHKLDNIESIRVTYDVLFPDSTKLREALTQPTLWKLYQRRNLIVHRRGIVDRAYLRSTSEDLVLGSELIITGTDLTKDTIMLFWVGVRLLEAAARDIEK